MMRLLGKLHGLNPRWLYLATVVVLIVPYVVRIRLPAGRAAPATLGLFRAIESCPPDKVVLLDSSWDQGSQAENKAQLECVVHHLCQKGIKFVVVSVERAVLGPEFANRVIRPIADKAGDLYGHDYVYGRDWANLGFVQTGGATGAVIDALCQDLHKIRPKDAEGHSVADLPLMQRVRSIRDVHLVYSITYAPPEEWISFAKAQYGTPVAFGCMTIMTSAYYQYLDSGQLCGMLAGNCGAGEYEALLGRRALGSQLILVASFSNGIVLAAALLGNLGLWAARRNARKGARAQA